MRIAIIGSGAVGGYYGALLARAGHDVIFLARGAHLEAMRAHGLQIRSPMLGDFTVPAQVAADVTQIGPVDLVLFAVKGYDNGSVLPQLPSLCHPDPVSSASTAGPSAPGPSTIVLTLQNGVDTADEVAAAVGPARVLAGPTYIATALAAPGVIEQTGTHRRIVFGEVFAPSPAISPRVQALADAFIAADIQAEPVADARVPIWEKFIYLSAYAAFSASARQPAGAIRADPIVREQFLRAVDEVHAVARAEGVPVAPDMRARIAAYIETVPGTMRASLLIDLQQGKRMEVEALQGAVVRRGARHGVATPVMSTLYAVLRAAAQQRV